MSGVYQGFLTQLFAFSQQPVSSKVGRSNWNLAAMNGFDRKLWQLKFREFEPNEFKRVASVLVTSLSESLAAGVARIDYPLDAVQEEQRHKIGDCLHDFVLYLAELGVRSRIKLPTAEKMGVPLEVRNLILRAAHTAWGLEEHLRSKGLGTDTSPIASCYSTMVEIVAKVSSELLGEPSKIRQETEPGAGNPGGALVGSPKDNPKLIYLADAAEFYNIAKSNLSKAARKSPGQPA